MQLIAVFMRVLNGPQYSGNNLCKFLFAITISTIDQVCLFCNVNAMTFLKQ